MASRRGKGRAGRWRRTAALFVGLLVVLAVVTVVVVRLRVSASQKAPQRLDLLYAAWNEYRAKGYDRATALLDRRAAEHEPTALDWMLRARIAESQGRLVEALQYLKRIPDSDAIGSQAWLKAGQIELARHNARGAEVAFRRSLSLDPDQIQGYRQLAYLYAVQHRRDECDAQFRALARRISLDYVLAFAWCQNYCRVWDPNEACRVLDGFVAFDPKDRLSRLALATNLRLANRLDQAEDVLRPLPDSDPEARAVRVEVAIDKGDTGRARALAHDGPADHAGLNALRGRLALANKSPARAADYFRAALRNDPDDHDSIRGLGLALRLVGDPNAREFTDAALRYDRLRRAIQGSTTTLQTDRKLFYKLGEHCEAVHRTSEARVWYKLAAKIDLLDTQAQQALDRLDQAVPMQSEVPIVNQR